MPGCARVRRVNLVARHPPCCLIPARLTAARETMPPVMESMTGVLSGGWASAGGAESRDHDAGNIAKNLCGGLWCGDDEPIHRLGIEHEQRRIFHRHDGRIADLLGQESDFSEDVPDG